MMINRVIGKGALQGVSRNRAIKRRADGRRGRHQTPTVRISTLFDL